MAIRCYAASNLTMTIIADGEEEAEVLSSSEAEVAEDSVEVASAEEWEEAEVPVPDSDLPKNLLLFY